MRYPMNVLKVIYEFLSDSNHGKHLLYGAVLGFVFTILCTLGAACALEFKDKEYGNKWDWNDWISTMLGGIIGQGLQLFIILTII